MTMRWWGWGVEEIESPKLPDGAARLLKAEFGLTTPSHPPVALGALKLPESRRGPAFIAKLKEIVGDDYVRDDARTRIEHAAGKSYLDLVRIRSGSALSAPDLVVSPNTSEQVAAVVKECVATHCAVVPFGGGTSVVGGVTPDRSATPYVLSLDLSRMNSLIALDKESMLATFGAGALLPDVENALAKEGFTLGHFPQSFEFASIGGCVAARSAGQASTGYGRIDEMVRGARLVTPVGELNLKPVPASSEGPSLLQMICGSEGTLGVITEVTVAAHRKRQASHYEGWMFRDFSAAAQFLREMIQEGKAPEVVRLSDDEETRITLALAGMSGIKGGLFNLFRGIKRLRHGCLCIFGWEGERADISLRRLEVAQRAMRAHGVRLGKKVGGRWKDSRFVGPYWRDHLLDYGVLLETFETSTTWSNLDPLRHAVKAAVAATLPAALLECHVSHLYRDGASLYFTVIGQQTDDPVRQWSVAKVAITGAIVQNGGALSHHHGIGSDHLPWMGTRVGNVGFAALAGLKRQLDPTGIMNPGKLIPAMTQTRQVQPAQA